MPSTTLHSAHYPNALKGERPFWAFYLLALLLGTFLRLYIISNQILIDDEWHGLDFVPGKSLFYLFTHFGSSAHCIPLNIYRFLLLQTFGWSELLLRIPSLTAGILSIAIFPLFVKKLFSHRTAIIFSFLLAISPLLIFYSRVSRGYSMVVFLGFLSICFLYMWAINGRLKFAVCYVFAGGLAVYFHLFALITVLAPLGVLFLFSIIPMSIGSRHVKLRIIPRTRAIIIVALCVIIFLCLLLLPALIQSSFPLVPTNDHATLKSLAAVLALLSGTSNTILLIVFLCLLVFGIIFLFRQNPLLTSMFLFIILSYFLPIAIVRHAGIDNAIEIVRFSITVIPISYLFLSVGLNNISKLLPSSKVNINPAVKNLFQTAFITIFVGSLFIIGPLPRLYGSTNNFTNHSAFQESYKKTTWEHSYNSEVVSGCILTHNDISDFYKWLSIQPDVKCIIEYPMFIGDHYNLFYYSQYFHRKEVLVGYISKVKGPLPSRGLVYANWFIDLPLSRIPDKTKLNFHNIIDMLNIESLKNSKAKYIILHRNLMAEISRYSKSTSYVMYTKPVAYLDDFYRKRLGPPVFETQYLIIFEIRR